MTYQNSFSSDQEFGSDSDFDDINSKSENAIKNVENKFNSNFIKKSDKLNSSINKTFLGSSAVDDKEFDQNSLSQENTDNSEIISDPMDQNNDSLIFENDFQDESSTEDNNYSTSINLISMEQIEKEVDDLIKNEFPIQSNNTNKQSQGKPPYRVTFKPEVHEMAYRSYQRNQIRKQQEREYLENMALYGNGYFEEEEEEAKFEPFEDDFIDKDQISPENIETNDNEEEDENENNSSVNDIQKDEIDNKDDIEETDKKEETEETEETVNDIQTDEIDNKDDENPKDEETVNSNASKIENESNDIITNETDIKQLNETEIENIPFIPPLDLSQFNSSKLISQSQTMNKSNKVVSSYHKPKRPVSSCSKVPECIIPTTNKTHSKSQQSKSSSPPNKGSPPKSSPPIKLDQFENQNSSPNNNSNNTKSPTPLLQQVQKSTESKAEELRNNGFLITFLNSPHIANKQGHPKSPKKLEQQDFTSLLLSTSTNPDSTDFNKKDEIPEENVKKEEDDLEKEEIKKYTDEELKKAIDDMLDHRILPPIEMHTSLQVYIKNNIYKNIIDQDYDQAERLKSAQDILSNGTNNKETANERKMIIQSIESRIESTKDKLHELKNQWILKIQKFEDDIHSKNDELELKQKEEVAKFEETWNSSEILVQFNKPSAQLLEIRRMQKTKALSNDFSGARELKKRGDLLEKEETRKAERKAMSSMKNAYNQLLVKQQREFEFAKQNWQRQRNLIENERDQEIHSIELTLKQLQNKLNEFKAKPKSNSSSRNLILSNSNKLNNGSISNQNKKSKVKRELKTPATTTPRTRKQIAKFRTQPRQEKLALSGLNVHQYVKSSSKSSSKGSVPHLIREKTEF